MDCVSFLKHLTLDCELGCGFLLFGIIKQVSENLGLFLLFTVGLKLLNSDWFSRVWTCLRGKSGELRNGFCSRVVLDWNFGVFKLPKELDDDETLFGSNGLKKVKESSSLFSSCDGNLSEDCNTGLKKIKESSSLFSSLEGKLSEDCITGLKKIKESSSLFSSLDENLSDDCSTGLKEIKESSKLFMSLDEELSSDCSTGLKKIKECSKLLSSLDEELSDDFSTGLKKNKESSKLFSSLDEEECVVGDNGEDWGVEDGEFNVSVLRKLVKVERNRANVAVAELEKERAASAIAAEEAMAMIVRLQNEKSLIGLESSQYRRLAEEKQIHDQKVIESLQWLVWRHESERGLLEDQLNSTKRTMNRFQKIDESEEVEEDACSFDGNILDALDNVLYSSRDANM